MSASSVQAPTRSRSGGLGIALRVVGAAALAFSGWVHYDIAAGTQLFGDGQVTVTGLFMGQAVVAVLVALWVLLRGDRMAWTVFLLVAGASLAALVASTYVQIPAVGPFPLIYDPTWFPQKVQAAVAAGVATLVALVALAALRRPTRTTR